MSVVRARPWIALLAGLALLLASCGGEDETTAGAGGEDETAAADGGEDDPEAPTADGDFPESRIRWIVPSEAGGGFDTSTRQLESHLARELGADFSVENLPGGNFAVGSSVLAREGGDCHAIGTIGIPHLLFSFMTQDVDYTYDDFHPVGRLTDEPGMIRVADDAPWETLEELIEDARDRPGEIRLSVSGYTSNNYLGVLEIEQATGADFNVVPYDGGNPARTALLSGEVEVTHAGVFNSLHIEDGSRVLAVHQDENRWAELTDDAPTVNEALGTDLAVNGSGYGVFAAAECAEQHPDRYQSIVDAFLAATDSEDYQAQLEEVGELDKLLVVEAEDYDQDIREEIERLEDLVDQYPELQEPGG